MDPKTGQPTIIESKWADSGRYQHPPDKVPDEYLPKDNPKTKENEAGKIEYHRAPKDRKPPPGSPDNDPDKEKNTLQSE